jgi:cyclohexanone monooxygenase
MTSQGHSGRPEGQFDAVIVGAGFAGMYMLHKLRGMGFSARVIERGTDVGGTWYWNQYPGARCDVESLDYQYSFSDELQREWDWTERYATQPEILSYAGHVAEKFDLKREIQFETSVTSATFDETDNHWDIETDRGDRYRARHFILATGCLSAGRIPDFKGLDSFEGDRYHTGSWPKDGVDFSGKDVAIIGTGSSGIQAIPHLAAQAKKLTVFQRTPNFSLPAYNEGLTEEQIKEYKDNFADIKRMARESAAGLNVEPGEESVFEVTAEAREAEFEDRWKRGGFHLLQAYIDIGVNEEANAHAAEFVRRKIRDTVEDDKTAELLSPTNHPIGTKRICIDSDYFETYNRDNVELVDISDAPITEITPKGIRNAVGEWEVDSIVYATGFDAMTGAILGIHIKGRGGIELRAEWEAGPRTYLGLSSAGFPNMYMITGPGSPSVLSNMIISIEQHVDWIADLMGYMREHELGCIEADVAAQDGWVEHVNEVADTTLFPLANSWYLGANVPGKARVFMPYVGGVGAYAEKCREVVANDYEGFMLGAGDRVAAG